MFDNFNLVFGTSELFREGGPFVVLIFASGVLMWALFLERFFYFSFILPRQLRELQQVWRDRTDHTSWCARQIRQLMISKVNAGMTANFPLMQVLVPMSPLLGLVGTVTGMLEVFDSMAIRGSADARTMASGVSIAMICTMTGLAVSITGLYPVHYFRNRARAETELFSDKLSF
jgi:biopolymer transport protein ExbB